MPTRIDAVGTYPFAASDRLFLDASVWLPIYAPHFYEPAVVRAYSAALRSIMDARASIYLDVLVLSEIVNSWSRSEHRHLLQRGTAPNSFKRFRDTSTFASIAATIAAACRRILADCERTGSCFETADVGAIFSEFAAGGHDFNDQMIREICRASGFTLVTHDGDYADSGLHVLTANQRLLATAP